MSEQRRRKKQSEHSRKNVTTACYNCRRKKVKCSGESPCPKCAHNEEVCEFPERTKRGPPSKKFERQMEARNDRQLTSCGDTGNGNQDRYPPSTTEDQNQRSTESSLYPDSKFENLENGLYLLENQDDMFFKDHGEWLWNPY